MSADDQKPLPTLEELFTGPFRCRCGVALDHWGSCEDCSLKASLHELAQRMRPARDSIPSAFRWATFERPAEGERNLLVDRLHGDAIRDVWALRSPWPRGVALVGPSGAGKTSLACALLRRIHDAAKPNAPAHVVDFARGARFVAARDLDAAHLEAKKFSPDPKALELLAMARGTELLVIDNVEPGTLDSGVGSVVMDRHDRNRPCTIVTTWMSFDEAAAPKAYGGGWARRVYETTISLAPKGATRAA